MTWRHSYKMGVMDFWGRFLAADKDGDGGLNRAEFTRLCRLQIDGISDEGMDMLLATVDKDHSGFIEYKVGGCQSQSVTPAARQVSCRRAG
jgi:hypothetical protein